MLTYTLTLVTMEVWELPVLFTGGWRNHFTYHSKALHVLFCVIISFPFLDCKDTNAASEIVKSLAVIQTEKEHTCRCCFL